MPKFHKDNRVYVDSLEQIAQGISDLVNRVAKGKIRFGKRKLNKTRTLNGFYMWILQLPDEAQDQILSGAMPTLKTHHDSEERIEIVRSSELPVFESLQADGPLGPGSDKVDRKRHHRIAADLSLPGGKK